MARKASSDTEKPVPFYEQVANILRTQITSDDSGMPLRLPAERDLCLMHNVSRITISKALSLLEAEGLIERTPGRGTLSVPPAVQQWQRLRQNRVIQVMTGWVNLESVPNTYYGQIYQGILAQADKAGYRLTTKAALNYKTMALPDPFLPDPASTLGIVFIGLMNEPTIQFYTQAGYPVVCVDYWTSNPKADSIVVDCYSEGQMAVDFLVRNGHRELFYMGHELRFENVVERESDSMLLLAGLQRGLDMAGLPMLPPERIHYLSGRREDIDKAAQWYMSLRPRPTAGLIFNSGIIKLILQKLQEQGLRCPEDVSIITKSVPESTTSFTGLRSQPRIMGELAVDTLLDRVSGKKTTAVRLAIPSQFERGRTVRSLEG